MSATRFNRSSRSTRRDARALFAPVGLLGLLSMVGGCGKVCSDDGFAWQQDPSCLAQLTATEATDSNPSEASESNPTGPTDPTEPTETNASSNGDGGYCVDADGDGFGDPEQCTDVPAGQTPPPGTVPNDDDCDDGSANTFPGAAPNDDPTACMKDEDMDDYGDGVPPGAEGGDGGNGGGIVPGSDCDDTSIDTFPGAAPKDDPTACMKDTDGDDWGDMNPPGGGGDGGDGGGGGGAVPGTDCDDANMNAWAACGTCADTDGDGWFTGCDSYPEGFPTEDCDDGDAKTFPGAAPKDDPEACMTDADDDDWGDNTPTDPEAVPGTDCDDASASTFPGAADLDDATACMKDEDEDGHGEADPENPDVTPGNDCNDAHPLINPTDSVLITAPNNAGQISQVDIETGTLMSVGAVDVMNFNPWLPTSLAVHPTDRSIYAALAFNDRLVTMNYCGGGMPTALPMAHNKELCGIGFDRAGTLYGLDAEVDQLVTFNADGSIASVKPLTFEGQTLNIAKCGMTYDCHEDRLLVSDSGSAGIYVVNTADGTTTRVADIADGVFGAGLAYEPVSKQALSCLGTSFVSIALDGSNDVTQLPNLEAAADDLDFAPACN